MGLLGWSSNWLTAGTILQLGSLRSFSRFVIPKFETPMFLALPVAGSFCISCLSCMLMKRFHGTTARSIAKYIPGLNEVPVGQDLRGVIRVQRRGPVHQEKVDVVRAQGFEGSVNSFGYALVPRVIKLGGDPNLVAGDARVSDTLADLDFIAIRKSTGII